MVRGDGEDVESGWEGWEEGGRIFDLAAVNFAQDGEGAGVQSTLASWHLADLRTVTTVADG